MRINNVTLATSSKNIWFFLCCSIVFFLLSVLLTAEYIDFTEPYLLPVKIFNAAWSVISSISDYEEKFLTILCIYVFPYAFLGLAIWNFIVRNKAIKSENSVLNLRYIEFKQDRIRFNFNRANCNFSCRYEDIKTLNMEINISKVRTKNGYANVVNYIALHFHVLDNKTFSITNTTINFKGYIYKIIDYTRNVQNFKYSYSGNGEPADLDEIIESYLKKGMKPILTKVQENSFKTMSILFFIIGIFFIVVFSNDIIQSKFDKGLLSIILFVPSVSIFLSIIFDIFLVIDKFHEKKFEGVTNWKEKHLKKELKI